MTRATQHQAACNTRKQKHAWFPFRNKKQSRELELAVVCAPFKTLAFPLGGLWEGGKKKKKKKGRGGFAVHSHVEAQSSNNLSQPALASYGLRNPAKTLIEQDYSLHLSFSDGSSLSLLLLAHQLAAWHSHLPSILAQFYQLSACTLSVCYDCV